MIKINLKILEESIQGIFHDIDFGNDLLDMAWKVQTTKGKMDTLDDMKLLARNQYSEKGSPLNGRQYLQVMHYKKGLIYRIHNNTVIQ